jgi:hypothetical protein
MAASECAAPVAFDSLVALVTGGGGLIAACCILEVRGSEGGLREVLGQALQAMGQLLCEQFDTLSLYIKQLYLE